MKKMVACVALVSLTSCGYIQGSWYHWSDSY
ncbi:hypothetical protein PS9374_00623 [Planomonospora sphaerica]|uniref:Lipoprotein n=1 Tax=Planomonospora sphaerica TaxID=161355 RepID=A0A161LU49_9ACTN|nr:hypothetical protein PS9374_00623 [Planomonospora sphaerica]